MPNNDSFQLTSTKERLHQENLIDLKKIFYLIISKWYYFVITIIVALICAFLFNRYTIPVFRVSATFLINEEKRGVSIENNELFKGVGIGEGSTNLDNQIMILRSRALIGKTLDELPFNIEYYIHGLFKKVPLFPNHPIKIVSESRDGIPRDIEFKLKYKGNNMFTLFARSKDSVIFKTTSSFGSLIKYSGKTFYIEEQDYDWIGVKKKPKIFFINHDRKKLVESYKKRIKVESISATGTIVSISLEGTNKKMDIEFLNKLTEIYLNNSLEKKNQEAIRTIQFIDDQLIGISDSLVITENKLQQFRSLNKVMDLSAQGQSIIDQAMNLENQKARLGIEANYYDYLSDYMAKDNAGQVPIAPATIGITDPGLTKLVADLAELQGQFYSKSLGEKNPLQSQLAQRVRNTKEALRETLNGVKRSNNLAMNEIMEQIRTVNAQASALPVTERQLLGIERKYKLNDELYTFLLEKRAEAQIQKASNIPDNEIVDPPEADILPVSPKKKLIYFLAIMFSIIFPFFGILIGDSFNDYVKEDVDIKNITDILISGHIPHCQIKGNISVFEDSCSSTAEAFRSLRSRMQYLTKGAKASVILITSSLPEEGKTFAAINLASAYSLSEKKTVIVDFDLRKPSIHNDFNLDNNQGISTWLIGKDDFNNIIKETINKNLSVITSGPIPPNPSELIALDKTEELLRLLKEEYECIILDTSPIGTVSDAHHLSAFADAFILVVRQNMTLKDQLESTVKELKFSHINSISIVLNDFKSEHKQYDYSTKYGTSTGKQKVIRNK
jgi:tyrosine-protein kinase Etk/Wzc